MPKYAKVLNEVVKAKGIKTNFRHNLVEVDAAKNEAVFENLDTKEKVVQKVTFIKNFFLYYKQLTNKKTVSIANFYKS